MARDVSLATAIWTVASVREILPAVRVERSKGVIVEGKLTGRANEYATVSIPSVLHPDSWLSWQFSWRTVADALNRGKPLKI